MNDWGSMNESECRTHAILSVPQLREAPPTTMECIGCRANDNDQDVRLNKCPICFKWACDNCAFHSFGRLFCSKKCSEQFFFGDDDE